MDEDRFYSGRTVEHLSIMTEPPGRWGYGFYQEPFLYHWAGAGVRGWAGFGDFLTPEPTSAWGM